MRINLELLEKYSAVKFVMIVVDGEPIVKLFRHVCTHSTIVLNLLQEHSRDASCFVAAGWLANPGWDDSRMWQCGKYLIKFESDSCKDDFGRFMPITEVQQKAYDAFLEYLASLSSDPSHEKD